MSQRIMAPNTMGTVASACLCPLYNYVLIHKYGNYQEGKWILNNDAHNSSRLPVSLRVCPRLQLGLEGAAYANMLSQATSTCVLATYVFWHDFSMIGDERGTWPGVKRDIQR